MSNTSRFRLQVRVLSAVGITALLAGTVFHAPASAQSVNQKCTKVGAKSKNLRCTKTKSGLRWTRVVVTTKKATPAPLTEAPSTDAVPATTAAAPTTAAAAPTTTGSAAAGAIAYSLKEWAIDGPAQLKAGTISLNVSNPAGNNKHELKIIKGTYAELPKLSNGAVDEEKLAAGSVVGKVEAFGAGETKPLSVQLTAGKYLFVCNIAFGPSSHAGRGQVLDVTVA